MARRFAVIDKTIRYKNEWMTVLEYRIQRDGVDGTYGVVERQDSVVMIVRRDDDAILLVRQYRFPTEDYSWELPMGAIDKGESPKVAAIRELGEETGVKSDLTKIAAFYPMPGLSPQIVTVFSGTVLPAEADGIHNVRTESDEIVERRFFSMEEISAMIQESKINGLTLSALAIFKWG